MDMTSETLKYLSDIGYKYKIIDDCKRKTYRLIKFKISKLKGWTFGLFKGQFETVFFCQPTAFIDKFKPSYSFYTAKVFEENIKEIDEVETREEFKLLKESGVSAIQELVQLVAMCNKAIESLDIGGENGN